MERNSRLRHCSGTIEMAASRHTQPVPRQRIWRAVAGDPASRDVSDRASISQKHNGCLCSLSRLSAAGPNWR